MEMYRQIPAVLTQRYEVAEESDSLVLRLQKAPLVVELCENPSKGVLFQANLMAPLRGMKNLQEGINALATLEDRRTLLHLQGYEGQLRDYDDGVEVTYDVALESPNRLQQALRDFSFPDYKFKLDVDLEHCIDPEAKRFTGYINWTNGKIILSQKDTRIFREAVRVYVNKSLEDDPTLRIGSYGMGGIELEAEAEETLLRTQTELCRILNETFQRTDLELIVERKTRDKP